MISLVPTRTRKRLVEPRHWLSSTARIRSLCVRSCTHLLTCCCLSLSLSSPSFPVTVGESWSLARDRAPDRHGPPQASHPLTVHPAAFYQTFLNAPKEPPDLSPLALRLWPRTRASSVSRRTTAKLKPSPSGEEPRWQPQLLTALTLCGRLKSV